MNDRSEDNKEASAKPTFMEELPTLVAAVAVALLIRTFLFQTFYVPSDSMFPTLLVGDHVFVNKFIFGARVPFTEIQLPGFREPERGEVVVFDLARGANGGIFPLDQAKGVRTDAFVKRLIGLPGDRISFRDQRLIINGEILPVEDTGRIFTDSGGRVFDLKVETLGSCRHYILDDPGWKHQDVAEFEVKPGRFFFMGDNRDNSHDGRRFGTVRKQELAGPAGLLYWSWNWNGAWLELLNPLTWIRNLTSETRWGRMGGLSECYEVEGEIPFPPENAAG
ncbi:MAG: signal peptidase I [Deltaproteobacteria bacterium]|nr:signal peptidase I [Deltaproteobacteria bacterium]MBW2395607.1 signal peptidase I [Deltaproteobacteria bacterium]